MTDTTKLVQYAQEIDFKRYAPDENDPPNFPQGRFFDLRTDPLELYSGLDLAAHTGCRRASRL